MNHKTIGDVHWSFWVVGAVALIWNVMGCANYLAQMNPQALEGFSDSARALVDTRPAWATAAFAIAVFGGALGCLLLLLRQTAAYYLFVASALGVVVTNFHTLRLAASANIASDIWLGSVMSLAVAALLIWYAKHAERKGWTK
jgi:hypothetical protein